MAMRMSGLMSGMDTETIIKELVSAKQTKVMMPKRHRPNCSGSRMPGKN